MFSGHTFPVRRAASVKLRPEKPYVDMSWLDKFLRQIYGRILWPVQKRLARQDKLVNAIIEQSETLAALSEAEFQVRLTALRQQLSSRGIDSRSLIESFALVREAAGRSLGMRHHHTQIRASLIMMQGLVAEMATGEGKTLACTLASATAALAGVKVHLVTTNDYLAERDCEEMLPLFNYLGINAQSVVNERSLEERRAIYAADIIYTSNNELVFDYLKDALVLGDMRETIDVYRDLLDGQRDATHQLMHQGLVFAIVDEADSVFIDESRTPLVISGGEVPLADSEEFLHHVMEVAQSLGENTDFKIDLKFRRIILLQPGKTKIEALPPFKGEEESLEWYQTARREELVVQALSALHLYHKDQSYIVDDNKVMIVDEYTGRLAPDRSWEGGLHQMLEIKEACEITKPQRTLSKISYQQFFRKYFYLAGMTGTAHEVRHELFDVYGLRVRKVPLLKKSKRRWLSYRVHDTMAQKEAAIVAAIQHQVAQGRAVLVGTATVDLSERLSAQLNQAAIAHQLLTAKQDAGEAEVVAVAGVAGNVTIATSMAGRGTDIKLTKESRQTGGLHVIICELQDAVRIDRQLEGRCARQGDPGSVEYILSFEDPFIKTYGSGLYRLLLPLFKLPLLAAVSGRWLQRYCQWRLEQKHARERKLTQRTDERERNMLAFLGGGKWR